MKELFELTKIDPWWLEQMAELHKVCSRSFSPYFPSCERERGGGDEHTSVNAERSASSCRATARTRRDRSAAL